MVVLRYGGLYADIDTKCGLSLETLIRPEDTFLAGWEKDFATAEGAVKEKFARQRQALQWAFAGTAGHPLLKVLLNFLQQHSLA